MTAEEIIAEVRLLASDMAIRGACPGEVSPSLQYRITDFLHRAGTPFAPWRDHRKYLTKTGTAICDGKEVPCQVHKGVVDDTAGELCREIAQCLMVSKWMMLPESKDWTADRAELAIKDAVARLPELCDRLEAYKTAVVKVEVKSREGKQSQHIDYRQPTKTRDDEPPEPLAAPKGEGTKIEVDELARYSDPLTALGKRILKTLWNHQFAVQFETLRVEAWEGDDVSDSGIERRLQDIEKRWTEAGLNDIDLEISPATTSVKLVKPIPKTGDKKGDN